MTLKATLDTAQFARRGQGGIDLRILSANDLALRSISMHFVDLDNVTEWKRLVKLTKIETSNDNLLLLTTEGKTTLHYTVANLSRKLVRAECQFRFYNDLDTKKVELPPQSTKTSDFILKGSGLPKGVHNLDFTLNLPGSLTAIRNKSSIGVVSSTKIPKAKPGEFMYGLDAVWAASTRIRC